MRVFSNKGRPVPLGAFPLERIRRVGSAPDLEHARHAMHGPSPAEGNLLAGICANYGRVYETFRTGAVAPSRAPYADALADRANDLKGLSYFFDATMAGLCRVPTAACQGTLADDHTHAIVLLVEDAPIVEADNPVHELIAASGGAAAKLRATEVAVILALYLRRLGYAATAHTPQASDVSLEMLAVEAGLARVEQGRLIAPFVGGRFALAAVTTEMELPVDGVLGPKRAFEGGLAWHFGLGGCETWWSRVARRRRPADQGRYPMETVKRVDETTTLIIDDEVPRLPKRSNGFIRALKGDMGDKAQREVQRFASKTPLASATRCIISAQQPHQDGPVAPEPTIDSHDPDRNRRAIKTLILHLGADLVGTSEAKRYVWYSHDLRGEPIEIYHKHAITLILDQGFDTMEGASGDDWVSATQSMRAYMRGAQIAGVTAAWIRSQGHSARAHTNIDSDVIQTPLIVLAGLGEMSRIGETVLNPFIGPRSKSAVVTTNMPMAWDRPIDFGLQDACSKCLKCARECPCDAITYGGTVMFNGYEQWKQDVQRCTSYRVTNQGGAACGRCMKTCPYNNEGLLIHRVLLWAATRFPVLRAPLARLDDKVGNGSINPIKRWWQELEIVNDVVVKPKRANYRTLDLAKGFGLKDKQKIAYTNADMLPPPDAQGPAPMDRKVGAQAAEKLETVAQARARVARGGEKPAHYTPTPPIGAVLDAEETEKAVKSLYGQSGADALMAKREAESDAGVA
jgi:reductive dehalogenase